MAERIVDLFEAIEIEHHHGKGRSVFDAPRQCSCQPGFEVIAVGQAALQIV
jgi:hypothetical protein